VTPLLVLLLPWWAHTVAALLLLVQMGPSGSGKTTMLDLLAGRKTVGKMEGTVLFSGSKPTRNFLRRYTGYVEQFGEIYMAQLFTHRSESYL